MSPEESIMKPISLLSKEDAYEYKVSREPRWLIQKLGAPTLFEDHTYLNEMLAD